MRKNHTCLCCKWNGPKYPRCTFNMLPWMLVPDWFVKTLLSTDQPLQLLTLLFSSILLTIQSASFSTSRLICLQTPVGDRRRRSGLWWNASVAWVSQCSARPALSETFHGRLWWCLASTLTGHTRRAWASSYSATQSPTQRKLSS